MTRKTADDLVKPLLVGESPSRSGDRYHMFPLSGRVARTLCELAGIPPQSDGSTYGRWTWALYERFECVNLFERYAEATPWSRAMASRNMTVILNSTSSRAVVCLGRKVQRALYDAMGWTGSVPDDFYGWVEDDFGLGNFVAIPHPSGLNQLLNDPVERENCAQTLRWAMRR